MQDVDVESNKMRELEWEYSNVESDEDLQATDCLNVLYKLCIISEKKQF